MTSCYAFHNGRALDLLVTGQQASARIICELSSPPSLRVSHGSALLGQFLSRLVNRVLAATFQTLKVHLVGATHQIRAVSVARGG